MRINIIEGEAGCAYAVEQRTAAVIVDALRASATVAMLLHHGAAALLVVREVAEAFEARRLMMPGALLFGERSGLPPDGFDFGNSPLDACHARERDVIFTSTTGAARLVAAWKAPKVLMASTINAAATARVLLAAAVAEVTLIPAGLAGDPAFDAQEDWAAAVCIAREIIHAAKTGPPVLWGAGRERHDYFNRRIEKGELETLFLTAPHADKLRALGMAPDLLFCARLNICSAVPAGVETRSMGVLMRNAAPESA